MNWLVEALFVSDDPRMLVAMVFGYVANTIMACQRFNRLAVPFECCEGLPSTRAWTTRLRYNVSALAYVSVCLFLFRVVQLYPELLRNLATGVEPIASLVKALMGDNLPQESWVAPLITTALVYLIFQPGNGVGLGVERLLRRALQRAGAIPRSVRNLLALIQGAHIVPPSGADLEPSDTEGGNSKLLRHPDGSVESLWARAHYLDQIVESWGRPASEFNDFWRRHQAGLTRLRGAVANVSSSVERYRSAEETCREHLATGAEESASGQRARAWLEAEEREAGGALRPLLDRLHITVACGLLASLGSMREALVQLERYGLRVKLAGPVHDRDSGLSGLREDAALLLIVLVIVIYPTAVVGAGLAGWQPEHPLYQVWFIWPMSLAAVVSAALWPALMTCRWVPARAGVGRRRWSPSVFAAALACVCGAVALGAIRVAECGWSSQCELVSLRDLVSSSARWGVLSAAIALGLGIALENRSERWQARVAEALMVGALAGIAGALAYAAGKGGGVLEAAISAPGTFSFVSLVCVGSGLALGWLIPHGYRKHAREVLAKMRSHSQTAGWPRCAAS